MKFSRLSKETKARLKQERLSKWHRSFLLVPQCSANDPDSWYWGSTWLIIRKKKFASMHEEIMATIEKKPLTETFYATTAELAVLRLSGEYKDEFQ